MNLLVRTFNKSFVHVNFFVLLQPIPPEILAQSNSAPNTPKTPSTPLLKPGKKSVDSTPLDGTKIKTEESDEDDSNLVIDESGGKGLSMNMLTIKNILRT